MIPEAVALIAGGKSTRMGRDKCLLEWEGQPLFERQLGLLRAVGAQHLWVVAPERPAWVPPDARWLRDSTPGCGPLGAVLAVLDALRVGPALVIAVDLPALTHELLGTLCSLASPARGVVPRDKGRWEPLVAIYPKSGAALAKEAIARGTFAMASWIDTLVQAEAIQAWEVPPADGPLFRNLNTPEDLIASEPSPVAEEVVRPRP